MTRTQLREWVEAIGLEVSEDGWSRLDRLVGLWQQYGRAINIVGATEEAALDEHIQEGLQCVACAETVAPVDTTCRWVDVGSGGGLPGLVVAAVRPCETILIEPRTRRAAFLDLGLAAIGAGSGRVIRARWSASTWNQEVAGDLEARSQTKFWVLSSRAVFSPKHWLETAVRAPITRGVILCHVDLGVDRVGARRPRAIIRGSRWSVMGFAVDDSEIT